VFREVTFSLLRVPIEIVTHYLLTCLASANRSLNLNSTTRITDKGRERLQGSGEALLALAQ